MNSVGVMALARRVLERNWTEGERKGVPYAYTRPSPSRYPWQWYWDSCFAAIVWRRFDRDRSRAELESLLRAGRPDGFVGHTIFWEHPVTLTRRVYYNVASRSATMTSTIQPPLLAWAWSIAVGDPAAEPRIVLPSRVAGGAQGPGRRRAPMARSARRVRPGLLAEVRPGLGLAGSRQTGVPIASSRGTGDSAGTPGGCETRAARCCARWSRTCSGDLRGGRSASPRSPRHLSIVFGTRSSGCSWTRRNRAGRAPPSRRGRRWHPWPCLTSPRRSAAASSRSTCWTRSASGSPLPRRRSLQRSGASSPDVREGWCAATGGGPRGSTRPGWSGWGCCVWATPSEADRMATGLADTVDREGLREYYHPRTGEGLGARDFAWTSLALEMANPDPRAASSYL